MPGLIPGSLCCQLWALGSQRLICLSFLIQLPSPSCSHRVVVRTHEVSRVEVWAVLLSTVQGALLCTLSRAAAWRPLLAPSSTRSVCYLSCCLLARAPPAGLLLQWPGPSVGLPKTLQQGLRAQRCCPLTPFPSWPG